MKVIVTHIALVLALVFSSGGIVHAHNSGATAYAIPLTGIQIDGKLDDWSEEMIRYPILNHRRVYGRTDIDHADLTTSADLSPSFMVGFDPAENLIYVAVQVRDDSVVVSTADPWHTDACEVYVDGSHRGERFTSSGSEFSASDLPALQYVLCPPGGSYGEILDSADPSANPNIAMGDISKTRTEGAVMREGDLTIYEWAIQAFDRYPDAPTKLVPGKTVGFDVVVIDKDSHWDNPAWICWAPFGVSKHFDAELLGDLVCIQSHTDLGSISGVVIHEDGTTPYPGVTIEVFEGKEGRGSVRTGENGTYRLQLLRGTYSVVPRGSEEAKPVKVTVSSGQETANVNFALAEIATLGSGGAAPELRVVGRHAGIFERAVAYEDEGKIAEAAAEYRLYLKKNQDVVPAYFYLANLYWDAGDQGRARETLKKTEKACPT